MLLFIIIINNIIAKEINIHYKRYEKDYKDWNLWIWEEGKEGKTYNFIGEDEYGIAAK